MGGNLGLRMSFSKAGFVDFAELVRSRRTVNNYTAEAVPLEAVKEALELSLWAPNHKLSFPWVYTLLGPQARVKLADLAVELKSVKGPLNDVKARAIRDGILNPAHLVSIGIVRSEPHREHEDYATLSCSVQIASMRLWEKHIGTKWSTGGTWMHPKTYDILGIDVEKIRLEGGLLIGVPQIMPHAPPRPPLSQFLKESM